MSIYFIDASAWAKLYFDEIGSDAVEALFLDQRQMACSSLSIIEMHSVVARRRRGGGLSEVGYTKALDDIRRRTPEMYQVELSDEVMEIAEAVAATYGLRAADTVHVASALYVRRSIAGEDDTVVLVASDGELTAAARMAGFQVLDPAAAN